MEDLIFLDNTKDVSFSANLWVSIVDNVWMYAGAARRGALQLWQFLVTLLDDPTNSGNQMKVLF